MKTVSVSIQTNNVISVGMDGYFVATQLANLVGAGVKPGLGCWEIVKDGKKIGEVKSN